MTPPQTLTALNVPGRSIHAVLVNPWARLLIPSLSDLFFLAVLVWVFMSAGAAGWQGLLADADTGWHIRTGQYILDHHTVPQQDLYSFSKPGAPWYAWEWGSDVFFGVLHRLAGLKGVVLSTGVILAAFSTTLIRRMIWRGTHLFIGLAVALLAVGSASVHFLARPHIFTLLLLSISVWMVESDLAQPSRRIWWLVPITVVWTNLHGGFLALIAVVGLAAVGNAVETYMVLLKQPGAKSWKWQQWQGAFRYAVVAGACGAASLVNPYGYKLHVHVIEYLRSDWIRQVIQEFQSPSFRSENMLQFEALLVLGLFVAASLLRRGRVVEALWIVFFIHEALGSVRHVPIYATLTAPAIAYEITLWWKGWTASSTKKSLAGIVNQMASDAGSLFRRTSIWPVAVVSGLALTGSPIPWPQDFPEVVFPTRMVHEHAAAIMGKRVLTTDQWGDYLIYTNPRQKVFVDGRSDFYGPEVGNQYLGLTNGRWDWRETMAKYGFEVVLLPTEQAIVQLLKLQPEWQVVEDDGKRILLVRSPTSVPPTGNSPTEQRF